MVVLVLSVNFSAVNFPRLTDPQNAAAIANADPLHMDEDFCKLPALNERGDVSRIIQILSAAIPSMEVIHRMTRNQAAAAMRDLGLFAASVKRHGQEPCVAIPLLEPALLALGAHTDMIPRETVFHYTIWNPRGERQRQFTQNAAEAALIEATRLGALSVEATIFELLKAETAPIDSPGFAAACKAAACRLEGMMEAVDKVRREVPPTVFAQVLRPYFEEIRVGGEKYNGAAAAPLSLGIVDHLLWSSSGAPKEFQSFQESTMMYNLPVWKRFYAATQETPSISERVLQEYQELLEVGEAAAAAAAEGCQALASVFQVLLAFRGKHLVLARSAYEADVRLYPVGSAGYSVETLKSILAMTQNTSRMVRSAPGGRCPLRLK